MKKIISAFLCMAMVLSVTACKKEDSNTIIVGTEPGFAPYEYLKNNEVVGIDMDIAQAIAEELGKELEIKTMDFDGALLAVQSGKVDFVAAGVSIDKKRAQSMDFSEEYVNSTEVVVVNKNDAAVEVGTDGTMNLSDKIVGVQLGNIADFWVEENASAKEIKRYTKFSQAAEDLKNNKIDCIVMDLYPARELVQVNTDLEIVNDSDQNEAILFEDKYAIAVQKGNKELLNTINKVIKKLQEEGKIEEFTKNHTSNQ